MPNTPATLKDKARRLIDQLPDDATWDDLAYQVAVRQAVEAGLKDLEEGLFVSSDEVRRQLGLPSAKS